MRCLHCGYNSFSHLEHCKKCGCELKRRSAETPNLEDGPVTRPTAVDGEDMFCTPAADEISAPAVIYTNAADTPGAADHTQDEPFLAGEFPADSFPLADTPHLQEHSLLGRRFLASVLDIAVILAAWLLFYTWGRSLLWKGGGGFFTPLLHSPQARGGFYLLLILIALAYFILFHYINGQTPGKIVTGIKVVSCDAGPLTLSQVLLRTCGGFVSALCLGVGYIAIWWAYDARGWNDKFADTCVEFMYAEDTSTPEYE
ncbi:MAG: RDD family protein [Desulfuromonadaceae bacterium]